MVNTGRLAELYPAGGEVTPESLAANGAVRRGELVKVLGDGDVTVALRVSAHAVSAVGPAEDRSARAEQSRSSVSLS